MKISEVLLLLGIGGLALYAFGSKKNGTLTGPTGAASGSAGSAGAFGGILSTFPLGSLFSQTSPVVQGDNTPAYIKASADALSSVVGALKGVGNIWGTGGPSGGIDFSSAIQGPRVGYDWTPGLSPAQSATATTDLLDTAPAASAGSLYYA